MMINATGGCQCGAVRYAAARVPPEGYWCHCRMCQRAFGSVAAVMVNVAKANLSWTRGAPASFASSAIARRGFCADFGTPLTFDYPDSAMIDLSVGSLDNPAAVPLTSHFGVESRVPHWIPVDDLPAKASTEHAPLVARWAAAAGGAPE